jgi:hypothetical protein
MSLAFEQAQRPHEYHLPSVHQQIFTEWRQRAKRRLKRRQSDGLHECREGSDMESAGGNLKPTLLYSTLCLLFSAINGKAAAI